MWQRGIRFPDVQGIMIPQMARTFMETGMKITCPTFQAKCSKFVERMMLQRLTKLFHNVTSKYRAKLKAMSKQKRFLPTNEFAFAKLYPFLHL
jgi:hypothetical protein